VDDHHGLAARQRIARELEEDSQVAGVERRFRRTRFRNDDAFSRAATGVASIE
jgi:hypothetical protein